MYHCTSVMIYHRGTSLSEQHTDLLIFHCTKQDLSCTNRYVDKIFTRDSQVLHMYVNSQGSYCQCGYIYINKAFTQKSWAEFLTFIIAIYAFPLPEATSTTVMIKICTACWQPAVDDLYSKQRVTCHVCYNFSCLNSGKLTLHSFHDQSSAWAWSL